MELKIKKWLEVNLVNHEKKHGKVEKSVVDHVVDWMKSDDAVRHRKRLEKVSVADAIRLSELWTKKLVRKAKEDEDFNGIEKVFNCSDGFYFVKVFSQQALAREGKLMNHCVGSYFGKDVEIYSLRDSNNKPHCTIEFNPENKLVKQIKGKNNSYIIKKYHSYVKEFLNFLKPKDIYENDLKNIYMVQDDNGKLHSLYDLIDYNNPLVINNDIYLKNIGIDFLPAIQTPNHFLDLSDNQISKIPERFKQNSWLDLRNNKISEIPKNFQQNGYLDLRNNQTIEIPETFKQNSWLDLRNNQISKIPENFKQNGFLNLNNKKISTRQKY